MLNSRKIKREIRMPVSLQWAIAKIMKIINPKFYGTFTLTFNAGQCVGLEVKETFKPDPQELT